MVVCILSPTFWKDDRNRVSEAAGIEHPELKALAVSRAFVEEFQK